MHILRVIVISFFATFGVAPLGACAAGPGERATGQVLDDSAVTARVKTALAREEGLGTAADVNVTTYRGVVQLSGFVQSEAEAQRAVAIARGIDGVQSVKNDLRVNPPAR